MLTYVLVWERNLTPLGLRMGMGRRVLAIRCLLALKQLFSYIISKSLFLLRAAGTDATGTDASGTVAGDSKPTDLPLSHRLTASRLHQCHRLPDAHY